MKILGNRVLVSRIEEEEKEGFQTVEIQDSFTFKGKVEQMGDISAYSRADGLVEGSTVMFAKYSPDIQDVEHEGKPMKIISVEDILAIL